MGKVGGPSYPASPSPCKQGVDHAMVSGTDKENKVQKTLIFLNNTQFSLHHTAGIIQPALGTPIIFPSKGEQQETLSLPKKKRDY